MWLFDKNAFTSTVAYDPKKDLDPKSKHKDFALKSENPNDFLLIRARLKEDLEQLEKKLGVDIMIQTDKSADYSFRALVSRDDFKKYLAMQVDGITYDSHFKEACRDASAHGSARYSALTRIWTIMADLQPYSPYGGYSGGSYYGKGTSHSKVLQYIPFVPNEFWTSAAELAKDIVGRSLSYFAPSIKMTPVGDEANVLEDDYFESCTDEAFLSLLTVRETADSEERALAARLESDDLTQDELDEIAVLLPPLTEDEFDSILTKVRDDLESETEVTTETPTA